MLMPVQILLLQQILMLIRMIESFTYAAHRVQHQHGHPVQHLQSIMILLLLEAIVIRLAQF